MKESKLTCKQKKIIIAAAVLCLMAVTAFIFIFQSCSDNPFRGTPTLTVETPQKISIGNKDFFTVDVSLSHLQDELYPAASFIINFDSSRLEFTGVQEGNILVTGETNASGNMGRMPAWSFNTEESNKTGSIKIMYLDMTGGKYAFSQELLGKKDNIVLRLGFRLRNSAKAGDIFELSVEDAVFAASDETKSLAMNSDTLKVRNGRIVTGE